jgi:hypothetical protein
LRAQRALAGRGLDQFDDRTGHPRRLALTEFELVLCTHLYEREVGTCWQGGSNIIDVAVSGLRRDVGDQASVIEPVRNHRSGRAQRSLTAERASVRLVSLPVRQQPA